MIPSKFILSHKPTQYRRQGPSHCGLFAAEGVISAYGKNSEDKHPKAFHQSLFQRIFGLTPPSLIVDTLRNYGFEVNHGNTKDMSNQERLLFLKKVLANDTPIIMHIGSGYWRNGSHKPLLGKLIGHWISLWGYDDNKEVFYIYDSIVAHCFHQKVPIGNVARPYKNVLRDWGQGVTPVPRRYEYVQIERISKKL